MKLATNRIEKVVVSEHWTNYFGILFMLNLKKQILNHRGAQCLVICIPKLLLIKGFDT